MTNRKILTPAAPGALAVAELKAWLGIAAQAEDDQLESLLTNAIEACEAFTGQMPLIQACEEVLPVAGSFRTLATRPVNTLLGVEGIAADGTRTPLASEDYAFELDADGSARLRTIRPGNAGRIAVQFTAGLAPDWAGLPASIRHGIERLASHSWRTRVGDEEDASTIPPAAVAALWRPYRRLRLQ